MSRSSYRPIQIATASFLSLVVVALAISASLTWRERNRLEVAQEQLKRIHVFERAYLEIQLTLAAGLSEQWPATENRWIGLHRGVEQLLAAGGHLDRNTPPRLQSLLVLLSPPIVDPERNLIAASRLVWEISQNESRAQEALLQAIRADADAQLRLEIIVPIALVGFGALTFFALRRQIIEPLSALQGLLSRLSRGNFEKAPAENVPALVGPVFENFNRLAERLDHLETAHRERERSLEHRVQTATRTLLEQQRSLARSERLAATGELAASFAHEVRNPLAGIQLALSNLKSELESEPMRQRVDAMLGEVMRLSKLLSEMLDSSRHQPERVENIDLPRLVEDLLAITSYQVPSNVRLESRIPGGLRCLAPEGALRQILLNLALNSAAALGETGGLVEVLAEPSSEKGFTAIRVWDDGPGYPLALLENGIQPFFSTRAGGTGLGLTLVQRLVRDAGGRIELRNRKPQGAETILLLPSGADHG